jgi:hypothetical protein
LEESRIFCFVHKGNNLDKETVFTEMRKYDQKHRTYPDVDVGSHKKVKYFASYNTLIASIIT